MTRELLHPGSGALPDAANGAWEAGEADDAAAIEAVDHGGLGDRLQQDKRALPSVDVHQELSVAGLHEPDVVVRRTETLGEDDADAERLGHDRRLG